MVVDVLAARDQLLVVVRGREEAAVLGVAEVLDHRVGGLARGVEPALVEGRLVERQQRLDQVGVVLEVGVELRLAVLVAAKQAAVLVAQLGPDELGARDGRVEVVAARQHRAGLGKRGDHQRVPRRQALVVAARPDAPRAEAVERAAHVLVPPRRLVARAAGQVKDVAALEVAALG